MDALKTIKSSVSITQMADKLGLAYEAGGGSAKAKCVFCDDTGKHLYLYQDSNRFHCYRCKRSGDAIDLAREGFKLSINALKSLLGHNIPTHPEKCQNEALIKPDCQKTTEPPEKRKNQADFSDLYIDFMRNLQLSERGREYLTQRGITSRLIDRYDLRSIENPNIELSRLLLNYPEDQLLESGLIDYSKKGKLYLSFFMPAIVFPHFTMKIDGIAGLSTRNLTGDAKSFKLHGISTPYYYGIDAYKSNQIYVFEGIINALSYAVLTNKDNFIALSGLISSAKYAELQSIHPGQELILGLDPDEPGKKALSQIRNCTYIDWAAFAQMRGFKGLQYHEDGKAWDLNDYLTSGGQA